MVKIGSLIGAIITSIGIIFQIIIFSQVFDSSQQYLIINNDGDITWLEMVILMQPKRFYVFIVIAVYFGTILILLGAIQPKVITYTIGAIIFAIGNIFILFTWFSGNFLANSNFKLGYLIISLSAILYFIGLIKHRKYNKIAPFSGALIMISMIITYFILGTQINYSEDLGTNPLELERKINLHLIFLCISGIIMAIHGWIISFSKKETEEETHDMQSVDEGSAFESFVDDSKTVKIKNKKGSKSTSGQDVEFKF